MARSLIPLPIDEILPAILQNLRARSELVVVAAPGAGKTTRIAPAILNAGLIRDGQQILMLQPRRVAARATAARIAQEQGWRLGEEVGYQIRFDNRVGPRTRLRIVTEGILERRLLEDPYLENVDCVIFDEFHERSLHTDLCLALLRETQAAARPDLRLIVMSATLDSGPVAKFLGDAPVVESKGRSYPVDLRYQEKSLPLNTGRASPLASTVSQAVRALCEDAHDDGGNVLVFLPGVGEIQRCAELLGPWVRERGYGLFPLHGSLNADDQDAALKPGPRRKIILSTNVAETSLTIDGVSAVVDTGLARVHRHDPKFGADRLELQRISRDSAEQRAGRAGRQGPGRCVRLWSRHDQTQLSEHAEPEIVRVDLAPTVLMLSDWGINDPRRFAWFEAPPEGQLERAGQLLRELQALDDEGRLTARGREMLRWPLEPRLALLCARGREEGLAAETSALAAILSEKDFLRRGFDAARVSHFSPHFESDPLLRLHLLESIEAGGEGEHAVDLVALRQVQRVRDSLLGSGGGARNSSPTRAAASQNTAAASEARDEALLQLLLEAYPDRVSRRRAPAAREARMVGGRGVVLDPGSGVGAAELFVAHNPFETRVDGHLIARVEAASEVRIEWLRKLFPHDITTLRTAEWNTRGAEERAQAFEARAYRDLPLEERRPVAPTPEELKRLTGEKIRRDPEAVLAQNESASRVLLRLRFLLHHRPELSWPDLSNESLGALLAEAVEAGMDPLRDKALIGNLLDARLNAAQRHALRSEAPDRLEAPSGVSHPVQYFPDGRAPQLSVRLQEVFGWRTTPQLAGGRVPVTLELLSPGFKPVQTTRDLASFWSTGYVEVRKELRARYPRHSWPDDPLAAPAVAKGRPRRS